MLSMPMISEDALGETEKKCCSEMKVDCSGWMVECGEVCSGEEEGRGGKKEIIE